MALRCNAGRNAAGWQQGEGPDRLSAYCLARDPAQPPDAMRLGDRSQCQVGQRYQVLADCNVRNTGGCHVGASLACSHGKHTKLDSPV